MFSISVVLEFSFNLIKVEIVRIRRILFKGRVNVAKRQPPSCCNPLALRIDTKDFHPTTWTTGAVADTPAISVDLSPGTRGVKDFIGLQATPLPPRPAK
jgi:hypothetical protein